MGLFVCVAVCVPVTEENGQGTDAKMFNTEMTNHLPLLEIRRDNCIPGKERIALLAIIFARMAGN